MTLDDLRREYELEVIGVRILAEVHRACAVRAPRYPPTVYARAASWTDDSLDDLVQDVVTHRLLGERQIDYLFDVGRMIEAWRALLDRQVRITLARRRVRTVVDNLLDRVKKLNDSENSVVRSIDSKQARYVLRGSDAPYLPLTHEEVLRVVERVRVVPRQIPGSGERVPTVYSKRSLTVLLLTVLRLVPGGVTIRDLGRILEFLLTDWVPAVLIQDEGLFGAVVEDPGEVMSAREAARTMVSGRSDTEVALVRDSWQGCPTSRSPVRSRSVGLRSSSGGGL